MTAEEYVQAHGDTFVKWLQDNTVQCACEDKYGCDESKRHCETIDAETEITCRRCFVPIGLQSVSLRAPIPGPGRKAARARARWWCGMTGSEHTQVGRACCTR